MKLEELGRMSIDEFKKSDKLPVCILLDNVRSLHNVGSTFRTADAFGVGKIFLTGITGTPPHREIQKTALGATESVVWEHFSNPTDAITTIKQNGYEIILIEQTTKSESLQNFMPNPNKKYCLVFGNEVDGISDEVIKLGDAAIEIPQAGTKHSLNVSVCLGIVVWEFYRKMKL